MKNKKSLMMSLAFMFIGMASHADEKSGGRQGHLLQCSIPQRADGARLAGIGYQLSCETQALAPQYSVRDCQLITQVVRPGVPSQALTLTQESQDASNTTFASDNGIKVNLNKRDFTAAIQFPNGSISNCQIPSNASAPPVTNAGTTGDLDCDQTLADVARAATHGNVNVAIVHSSAKWIPYQGGYAAIYTVNFNANGDDPNDQPSPGTAVLEDARGAGCFLNSFSLP